MVILCTVNYRDMWKVEDSPYFIICRNWSLQSALIIEQEGLFSQNKDVILKLNSLTGHNHFSLLIYVGECYIGILSIFYVLFLKKNKQDKVELCLPHILIQWNICSLKCKNYLPFVVPLVGD